MIDMVEQIAVTIPSNTERGMLTTWCAACRSGFTIRNNISHGVPSRIGTTLVFARNPQWHGEQRKKSFGDFWPTSTLSTWCGIPLPPTAGYCPSGEGRSAHRKHRDEACFKGARGSPFHSRRVRQPDLQSQFREVLTVAADGMLLASATMRIWKATTKAKNSALSWRIAQI